MLQWFSQNEMDKDAQDEEALKFQADFLYFRKNYQEAQNYFKRILQKSSRSKKSSASTPGPLFRDSCESYIRCLVYNPAKRQSELDEALALVKDLILRTNPANLEQMANCYDMLTLIYGEVNQPKRKAAAQISQIKLHPQVSGLWIRLAETFQLMDDQASNTALSCRQQAKRLFKATEKSLPDSYVQACNKQAHHDLFQFNALDYSSVDKNIDGDMKSEVEKDFIDLGSSQLRQRKEKEIEQLATKQIEHPPSWLEDDHSLHEFIQSFIDESCQ